MFSASVVLTEIDLEAVGGLAQREQVKDKYVL